MWDYLQNKDALSLLDMPVSSPPMTANGSDQPWEKLLDWSVPSGVAQSSLTGEIALSTQVQSLHGTHIGSASVIMWFEEAEDHGTLRWRINRHRSGTDVLECR
jgi:hypothetical protein